MRFALTGEAGLNDGTAFPFVMLGLGLLGLHELGADGWRWVAVDLVWAVVGGLAIGALWASHRQARPLPASDAQGGGRARRFPGPRPDRAVLRGGAAGPHLRLSGRLRRGPRPAPRRTSASETARAGRRRGSWRPPGRDEEATHPEQAPATWPGRARLQRATRANPGGRDGRHPRRDARRRVPVPLEPLLVHPRCCSSSSGRLASSWACFGPRTSLSSARSSAGSASGASDRFIICYALTHGLPSPRSRPLADLTLTTWPSRSSSTGSR